MGRLVTDDRLDRAIHGFLVERVGEIDSEASGVEAVAERIAARPSRGSTRPPVGSMTLIAAGLALTALAGVTLLVGNLLLRPTPIPGLTVACETVLPWFRLLSDEEAGISIQVPDNWKGAISIPSGSEAVVQAGTDTGEGLAVVLPSTAPDLEAAVTAVLAIPDWAAWGPYARTDLMHGTHRALRLESRTPPDAWFARSWTYSGEHILYIVERSDRAPVVVSLTVDGGPLGLVERAILRSLNPDGSGPAVLTSFPWGSPPQATQVFDGCPVAW